MGLEVAALAKSPAIMAAADERSAASRYWASSTKTRLSLVADCRLETLVTVMELSPRRRQPSCSARSRRVCFMVVYCRFMRRVCTTWEEMRSQIAEVKCRKTSNHRGHRGAQGTPTREGTSPQRRASTGAAGLLGVSSSGGAPRATGRDIGG